MKKILEDYGEAIIFMVVGLLFCGFFIFLVNEVSNVV